MSQFLQRIQKIGWFFNDIIETIKKKNGEIDFLHSKMRWIFKKYIKYKYFGITKIENG